MGDGFEAAVIEGLGCERMLQRNGGNLEFSCHRGTDQVLVSSRVNECLREVRSVVLGDTNIEEGMSF